jgi:hypothetical protein
MQTLSTKLSYLKAPMELNPAGGGDKKNEGLLADSRLDNQEISGRAE